MKKIFWFALGIVLTISITAYASTSRFADEASFDDWFKSAVDRLSHYEVIKGYPDGSFKPENPVSRAELAVILERFEQNILEKWSFDIANDTTIDFATNIQKIIEHMWEFENTDYDYKPYLIIAESGLKELHPPKIPNIGSLELVEDANLPSGFKLYVKPSEETPDTHYLLYEGYQVEGDMAFEVQQWYGPFYQ